MKASVSAGTILLVEDEMETAAEIERGLERIGYHSCSVSIADLADTVRTRGAVLLILDRILRGVDSLRTLEGSAQAGYQNSGPYDLGAVLS